MPCSGDPSNSVYVSIGLDSNAGSRPGPAGCADSYQANYEDPIAWLTARARDLVTADETEIAECYNDWPGGLDSGNYVDFTGFTTGVNNRVIMRSASGHKPINTPEDGFHLIRASTAIRINMDYVTLEGIGVVATTTATTHYAVRIYAYDYVHINGCFLRTSSGVSGVCFYASSTGSSFCELKNSFLFGGSLSVRIDARAQYIYNNTIYGAKDKGIDSTSSTAVVRNNVVFGTIAGVDYTVSTTNASGNVSEDGSAPGEVYTITNPSLEFVGSDGSNLHILETAGFRDLASDLSVNFTDDIDGDTRYTPWDCGADEFQGITVNAVLFGVNF